VKASPEPLLTLDEACQQYFPGRSACALRWMIKRRGYAHNRWGREYRLTPSQVAAIVADLARPATPPVSSPLRKPTAVGRTRSIAPATIRAAFNQPARAAPTETPGPSSAGHHYSITFALIRGARIIYRCTENPGAEHGPIRTADHVSEETTLIVGNLFYAGSGWETTGDALLANAAADQARRRREAGREDLAHEQRSAGHAFGQAA
jgi:hypothetical protein